MIRKGKARKAAFIDWLVPQLEQAGYAVTIEQKECGGGPRNIVIGDVDSARYVFTAHYDTPAVMPFPNFAAPRSLLFTLLYQLAFAVAVFLAVFAVVFCVTYLTGDPMLGMIIALALLFGLMVLMLAGPANKNNYNDNTSGVVTVLETALALPKSLRDGVAFVLFDLEELGLVGSAAFQKKHGAGLADKLVINFDCVSDGDDLCFCLTKDAKKQADVARQLRQAFEPAEGKQVTVVEKGFFFYPSDQLAFKRAVGVCALRTNRFSLQYISRIHTKRDTVFDTRNILLLRDGALRLAASDGHKAPLKQGR